MKYFVLIVLILLPFFSFSQTEEDLSHLTYEELDSLMMVYYQKGAYKEAIKYILRGKEKSEKEKGKMTATYATYIGNLGSFYFMSGQYDKSEKYLLESVEISKVVSGEEHDDYGNLLNGLADFYRMTGRYEEAEPHYLMALSIKEKTKGIADPEYAIFLNNLGLLYWKMGKYNEAESLYLQANKINLKTLGKQHGQSASVVNNLALLYTEMAVYDKAEMFYLQALNVKEKMMGKEHPNYAISLENLANLYNKMERYVDAERCYQASKKIKKKVLGVNHPSYATTLNNLAFLYMKTERYKEAELLYWNAKEIRASVLGKNHPYYALSLNNLALLYTSMEQYDTAFAFCMAGIAANTDSFLVYFPTLFAETSEGYTPDQCCHITTNNQLLRLAQLNFHSYTRMQESLQTLLKITKKQHLLAVKDKGEKSQAAIDQLTLHYTVSKAAMLLNNELKNSFINKENKLRILSKNNGYLKYGINAAKELGEKYYSAAFSFAEQNKSILLADAIKGDRARSMGDLPKELLEEEMELQTQRENLKKRQYKVKNQATKDELIVEENALNVKITDFLGKLKNNYPQYHHLKYEDRTVDAENIQKLMDENSLLLEYFVTDTTTYLFAISKEKIILLPLSITRQKLRRQVKKMHNALSNYTLLNKQEKEAYDAYTQAASWFYKHLLKDVLTKTTAENLIIITDDELGHLPFETFLVEDVSQKRMPYSRLHYLINDYTVSYSYSASLWKENLEQEKRKNNQELLACAGSYVTEIDSSLAEWHGINTLNLRKELISLPAVEEEVKALEQQFKGRFLQGEDCNEAYFKANAQNYSVIHLAMHGVLHPRVPLLSSLAFTENKDSIEDNFLEAYEISQLNLNADMVVLSACETGYGKFEQGEGIVSLARSFMYAGTPSLIVSLWQVNDHSTAMIMTNFYNYLVEGMRKDQALRHAKLAYLKEQQGMMAHPAFWSPFIQLGNNDSIKLKEPISWIWWGIGLGVVMGIFWVLIIKKQINKRIEA